jgi:hypothetical protein
MTAPIPCPECDNTLTLTGDDTARCVDVKCGVCNGEGHGDPLGIEDWECPNCEGTGVKSCGCMGRFQLIDGEWVKLGGDEPDGDES